MSARPKPPISPMQVETLLAFYYGEVQIYVIPFSKNGYLTSRFEYISFDGKITGRVQSLFNRQLIKCDRESQGYFATIVTPNGLKELAKRGEI